MVKEAVPPEEKDKSEFAFNMQELRSYQGGEAYLTPSRLVRDEMRIGRKS